MKGWMGTGIRWGVCFALVVVVVLGCLAPTSANGAATGTSTEHHLTWDGVERLYRLYVPADVNESAPLVVMMHGGGGNAEQAERAYGWDALADKEGFVVAYPQAEGLAWNAGSCCGRPAATGVDDVGFIDAMVKEIAESQSIDPTRIFAAGMSNGAMMAYRLACESTIFAAIAPVSGTMMVDCRNPVPESILHIHGLADQNVPFDGSKGAGIAKVDGPPVLEVIAFWRKEDDCEPPTSTVSRDDVLTTSIAECPDGRTVELITIAGAGHQWPTPNASAARVARRGADAPYAGLDATQTIWDFFADHPRAD